MSVILNLKKREAYETLYVDAVMISKVLNQNEAIAGRQLVRMFEDLKQEVHDKVWLTMIVNWSPEHGISMLEMVPWLKIAERVAAIDDKESTSFTLSKGQADLIYERLSNADFKLKGLNPALATFVLMFYEAIGKNPDTLNKETLFDDSEIL